MNKTALLLLAVFPALALADVNLYGNIRSGLTVSQTEIGGRKTSNASVDDLGSYIGLRGTHPIGGSSNVIWQFQDDVPVGRSDSLRQHFRQRKNSSAESGWYVGVSD
ncbi:porin [Uruburuella testudinis]|uniref:Porin n=1 Tax=Uruburuella testudinis TaxID=1282863 RepID=A0ABY4DRJ5_9NEIS|nr:porin [Uruburuella testudinis]UOO81640.1 porin [Uruburuella testudinis]